MFSSLSSYVHTFIHLSISDPEDIVDIVWSIDVQTVRSQIYTINDFKIWRQKLLLEFQIAITYSSLHCLGARGVEWS